jgi:hypothetical protein
VPYPAHGFADGSKPRLVLVWSCLSVARNPHHDETGVDGAQGLVPEAPFLQRARPEVLDDDITPGDETAGKVLPLPLPQIDGDGFLVAGDDRPPEGAPLLAVAAPHAHGVPFAWRLELYDLGAEVREELAAERACEQAAHLDDANAFERPGPIVTLSHSDPLRGLL